MEHPNAIVFCILISVTSLFSPITSLPTCEFPAIFNLGDSNSDTGGLSAAFGQAPYPHGITHFHHPAGRFCDGRLLIDFIADDLGLPYLTAYLDSMASNFSHGANFATAGSTIRPQTATMSQSGVSPISLDVQFVQYSDFHQRSPVLRKQGGVSEMLLPMEDYFKQALYTFDIGQNDLTAGYKLNMTSDQVKAYIPDVLRQFSNVVKGIYAQGGRSFWIHNTGPVGCLPYSLDRFLVTAAQINKYGCATPFNEVAQFFNRRLKEVVFQLRKDLPSAAITYVDVYSLKYSLFTKAKKLAENPVFHARTKHVEVHYHFVREKVLQEEIEMRQVKTDEQVADLFTKSLSIGKFENFRRFEEPLIACCGHGGRYNFNNKRRCGSKITKNGKEIVIANACKDPSTRVIWDGIHFTEAANRWMFNQVVNGAYSDPPIPLKMACHRMDH
ncbi:hypothetical protein JRO89_XS05G0093900 [Xanthoceras sorbifolium]|uniref:Uncharacterized protein n=1 Tax=Xanthoceras sorbifolium TaxID=99658 RepID=A0ABQ8I1Q0_9ROSI|nr:hypothetical protein JRO89_XS05G0093900 [Xanthoceras sorbifolium]